MSWPIGLGAVKSNGVPLTLRISPVGVLSGSAKVKKSALICSVWFRTSPLPAPARLKPAVLGEVDHRRPGGDGAIIDDQAVIRRPDIGHGGGKPAGIALVAIQD